MDPTCGFSDQLTPVSEAPVTVAVKVCTSEDFKLAAAGLTVTATGAAGFTVTMAELDLVGSATLVAVTVTCCGEATVAGAVYVPDAEIDPAAGEIDHVTAGLLAPVTVAVKACVELAIKDADGGFTATVTGPGTNVTVAVADLVGFPLLVAVIWTATGTVIVSGAGAV